MLIFVRSVNIRGKKKQKSSSYNQSNIRTVDFDYTNYGLDSTNHGQSEITPTSIPRITISEPPVTTDTTKATCSYAGVLSYPSSPLPKIAVSQNTENVRQSPSQTTAVINNFSSGNVVDSTRLNIDTLLLAASLKDKY